MDRLHLSVAPCSLVPVGLVCGFRPIPQCAIAHDHRVACFTWVRTCFGTWICDAADIELASIPDMFDEKERAGLALTEAITELHHGHVPDEVYAQAAEVFSERELGQVIALAVTINAWNRINVATRLPAPRR